MKIWVVYDPPSGPRAYFSSRKKARKFCKRVKKAEPDFDWDLKIKRLVLDTGKWAQKGVW